MYAYSERNDPDWGDDAHGGPDEKVLPTADYTTEDIVAEAADAHF